MLKFIKGIQNLSADHHSHEVELDEPDNPRIMLGTVIVICSFIILLIVGFFAYILLWKTTENLQNEFDTGMANKTRLNYIKQEDEILSSYKKLDNGLYQIPIKEAMELVIKEQGQ